MKVVFLGSGSFALPTLETLERLSSRYPLTAVISRPDRPGKRGRKLYPTLVKQRAAELGLDCLTPHSVNAEEFLETMTSFDGDIFIVADYGEILRQRFLEVPRLGTFNLHASLLPKYRGASPVAHALLDGETATGVTLFRIEEGLDTGDVVRQESIPVDPAETAGELKQRLSVLAAELLEKSLEDFAEGTFTETPQKSADATLAPKLRRETGLISWDVEPATLHNTVRALNPWPVAYTHVRLPSGATVRTAILRVVPGDVDDPHSAPGAVVDVTKKDFQVACRGGSVRILEVQRQGKTAMTSAAYLCGHALKVGDHFG